MLKCSIGLICVLCSRELVDKLLLEACLGADGHVEALLTCLDDVLFAAQSLFHLKDLSFFFCYLGFKSLHFLIASKLRIMCSLLHISLLVF